MSTFIVLDFRFSFLNFQHLLYHIFLNYKIYLGLVLLT